MSNRSQLQKLSKEMEQRVAAFEGWLNCFDDVSRVELEMLDDGGYRRRLYVDKDRNQKWFVAVVSVYSNDGKSTSTRLCDASIGVKIEAFSLFPQLVERMRDNRNDILNRMQLANDAFDKFAASIGIERHDETEDNE